MLGTFRRQKTIHNTLGPFGCLDFHGNEPFPLAENEAHFIQKVHFCQVISLYLLCFQGEKKISLEYHGLGRKEEIKSHMKCAIYKDRHPKTLPFSINWK